MFGKFRTISFVISLMVIFSLFSGVFTPNTTAQAREGGSLPVSPAGMISDTTPTYKWYKIITATKYEYEMYKGTALVYKKNITGSCGTTYCTHTPTTPLSLTKYKWRIRFYDSAGPQAWSEWKYFQVVPAPKDFDSQFNGSMPGWLAKPGAPWYVNSTYLYTAGVSEQWSSIYNTTSPVYTNFDYLVKFRANKVVPTCLAVRMGSNFDAAVNINLGYPGYIFCSRNDGYYSVWYTDSDGAHLIQAWTFTSAYVLSDWNKHRVVAIGPYFQFYINDDQVYAFKDSQFTKGSIGITGSRGLNDGYLLEVDYAKLRVLFANSPRPIDTILPEQQALNEAAARTGSTVFQEPLR